jgi:hypothetical protein
VGWPGAAAGAPPDGVPPQIVQIKRSFFRSTWSSYRFSRTLCPCGARLSESLHEAVCKIRISVCHHLEMNADRAEVSRDEQNDRWLIRIHVGEEVIRRPCHESRNADEETLRGAAVRTAADEGYTIDPLNIVFS